MNVKNLLESYEPRISFGSTCSIVSTDSFVMNKDRNLKNNINTGVNAKKFTNENANKGMLTALNQNTGGGGGGGYYNPTQGANTVKFDKTYVNYMLCGVQDRGQVLLD
eukprot:CAMPEP_0116887418 /NCGR_PEP_ID=MMETSP0463-20121206/21894_1 /TAXON_ID=181622 /ORGANISM="Strombidinopsis sp, Strain SopsisLIS2011" /LENGTH=107 /DNA_ID=CAMNT_0004550071 /DNA_START=869 /DNA_END=1192 /DNA_ORIENTATION=+